MWCIHIIRSSRSKNTLLICKRSDSTIILFSNHSICNQRWNHFLHLCHRFCQFISWVCTKLNKVIFSRITIVSVITWSHMTLAQVKLIIIITTTTVINIVCCIKRRNIWKLLQFKLYWGVRILWWRRWRWRCIGWMTMRCSLYTLLMYVMLIY